MRQSRQMIVTVLLLGALGAAPADPGAQPSPPGADWENYNNSLDGQRFSPLSQITAANVSALAEVCRVRVAARGSLQSGLIVIADSMFVTTPTETLAVDPLTCRIKWEHSYRRRQEPGLQVNRGPAYLNGRVFRGTDDGRLIALDAATGAELWTSVVGDPTVGEYGQRVPDCVRSRRTSEHRRNGIARRCDNCGSLNCA